MAFPLDRERGLRKIGVKVFIERQPQALQGFSDGGRGTSRLGIAAGTY